MRTIIFALVLIAGAPLVALAGTDAKLPTDAPVRAGMVVIRDLVRTNHSLVTHRRMPPDHAARFARQIAVEADAIRAKTRIPGPARARLDVLLGAIIADIEAVAKPSSATAAIDGIVRADEALAHYGKEFDHPGWAPLRALPDR